MQQEIDHNQEKEREEAERERQDRINAMVSGTKDQNAKITREDIEELEKRRGH